MLGSESRVARELADTLINELSRIGLLFRVFYRAKEEFSLRKKIQAKGYSLSGRQLQDFIGIRVALYFSDDIGLCRDVANSLFESVEQTIDQPENFQFMPVRYNLVYRLPETYVNQIEYLAKGLPIDKTFELQIRTVLSEGWHEVEHDLRYKCRADWEQDEELSRILNGTMATLENADWSMMQIFDRLSYRHYKRKNWNAMIRHKLRMRLQGKELSNELSSYLTGNGKAAKELFRVDRGELLRALRRARIAVPLTMDNMVQIMNHIFIGDLGIASFANEIIAQSLEQLEGGIGK